MKFTTCLIGLTIWCAAAGVRAAGADPAAPIAPFVNNFTLAVARIEPGSIDFDALARWGDQVIGQSKMNEDDLQTTREGLADATAAGKKWAAEFTRAGGKTLWVVFTVESFPEDPVFLVAPLENGSDGQALQKLMSGGQAKAIQMRGAIVSAPRPQALQAVRGIAAQPRPELGRALGEAADAKVRVAIIPSDDARRVIGSMLPKLPDGQQSDALTMGVLWAAVTISPPPGVSVKTVVQGRDAASAEQFRKLLSSLVPSDQHRTGELLARALGDIATAAQVKGDRVVIDLNEQQTSAAAANFTVLLRRARVQASRVASASNIRQLLIGMQMFANEHKGEFPDTLEQAAKRAEVPPAVLINPGRPAENPGYVYIKPPDGFKAGSDRVVLYEKYKPKDQGINLGFADGHVEFWPLQTAIKQIEAAKAVKSK